MRPSFWELLKENDRVEYQRLKISLDTDSGRRNRGHRTEAFGRILASIRTFCERGDENDWRRFLVCGICWMNMDEMIAINTRQLRLLISKCKSSINGSLQKLGYTTNPTHSDSWKFLFDRIPILRDNYSELRQWTIRKRPAALMRSVVPQKPPSAQPISAPPAQTLSLVPIKFKQAIINRQLSVRRS